MTQNRLAFYVIFIGLVIMLSVSAGLSNIIEIVTSAVGIVLTSMFVAAYATGNMAVSNDE